MTPPFSKHATVRHRQRGFRDGDIDLIQEYGTATDDGILLRRKDVDQAMNEIRAEAKRKITKLERLEGTYVAMPDESVVTFQRAHCRKQRSILKPKRVTDGRRRGPRYV